MALSLVAGLQLSIEGYTIHKIPLLWIYFAGAAASFPIAIFVARFLSDRRTAETRFAAVFLCLSTVTVGITAILFALIYRNLYAQWHGEFLTVLWTYQFIFTTASALVQFAVIGLRLYFPVGFVFLIATSFWLAASMR